MVARNRVANTGVTWDEGKARLMSVRASGAAEDVSGPSVALLPLADLILSPPPTFLCNQPLKLSLANSSWSL